MSVLGWARGGRQKKMSSSLVNISNLSKRKTKASSKEETMMETSEMKDMKRKRKCRRPHHTTHEQRAALTSAANPTQQPATSTEQYDTEHNKPHKMDRITAIATENDRQPDIGNGKRQPVNTNERQRESSICPPLGQWKNNGWSSVPHPHPSKYLGLRLAHSVCSQNHGKI